MFSGTHAAVPLMFVGERFALGFALDSLASELVNIAQEKRYWKF